MKKKIIFRVDSSSIIGLGHLIRCITLANVFKKNNFDIEFISSNLKVNKNFKIKKNDFKLNIIKKNNNKIDKNNDKKWLGSSIKKDLEQTISILKKINKIRCVNLLIVDHYSLGYEWEKKIKTYCEKILVIDDYHDRNHQCDFFVNPTLPLVSSKLIKKNTFFLNGPKYIILRDQFRIFRKKIINRNPQIKNIPKKILIIMGSSENLDFLNFIINSIYELNYNFNFVLVTKLNNNLLKNKFKKINNIKVLTNIDNIAYEMYNADILICSASTVLWEAASLGIPTIAIKTEKNQKHNLDFSNKFKISVSIKNYKIMSKKSFQKKFFNLVSDFKLRLKMSRNMIKIVDTHGSKRIVDVIKKNILT